MREIELTPDRAGMDGYLSDEMFIARGNRHVDSLKSSTVFEDLADGMSPGSLASPPKDSSP